MWKKRFVLMRPEGETPPGGGTPPAASTPPATPPAATPPATPPASVLNAGANPPAAAQVDFIPEKYRTNKEDGSLDLEASARKLAEAYGHAEQRIGSGDIRPKEASEYQVTVPDALKEAFDPAKDAGMQQFLTDAHSAGLTQKQLDMVMGKYFELAPQLVAGAKQFDADTCKAELEKTWATEADFNRNVRNAYVGAEAAARKAGLDIAEIMNGPLGNDPTFLKLFAALGPEFNEDTPPGGESFKGGEDVTELMKSEAYRNPKHPDHAKVSAQVKAYYEKKFGTEAAA